MDAVGAGSEEAAREGANPESGNGADKFDFKNKTGMAELGKNCPAFCSDWHKPERAASGHVSTSWIGWEQLLIEELLSGLTNLGG